MKRLRACSSAATSGEKVTRVRSRARTSSTDRGLASAMAARGGRDDVLDHPRDQPALDFVGQAAAFEVGPAVLDFADDGADEGDIARDRRGDEAGTQRIVDVVGVVGGVVGDGGDLRFEAGVGLGLEVEAGRPRTTGPLCLRMPSSVSQVRLRPSCSA